jgi:hypothetical protein
MVILGDTLIQNKPDKQSDEEQAARKTVQEYIRAAVNITNMHKND